MKKENIEKIENLITQIMKICEEEKEKSLCIGISGDFVSAWGDTHKPRCRQFDLFSNDRGKTWTDMR